MQLLAMPCMSFIYLCVYTYIGRPVVMNSYDEDILDASVDSSTSDQQDAAKHGQFICLHYACSFSWHKENCIASYTCMGISVAETIPTYKDQKHNIIIQLLWLAMYVTIQILHAYMHMYVYMLTWLYVDLITYNLEPEALSPICCSYSEFQDLSWKFS